MQIDETILEEIPRARDWVKISKVSPHKDGQGEENQKSQLGFSDE